MFSKIVVIPAKTLSSQKQTKLQQEKSLGYKSVALIKTNEKTFKQSYPFPHNFHFQHNQWMNDYVRSSRSQKLAIYQEQETTGTPINNIGVEAK